MAGSPRERYEVSPYTGEAFTIEYQKRGVWAPVGIFDPRQPFDTEAAAVTALAGTKGGRKRKKPVFRCPYTGRAFKIKQNPRDGKWYGVGLWSPVRPYGSPEEARWYLSRRAGQPQKGLPKAPPDVSVREITEPPPDPREDPWNSKRAAENIVERVLSMEESL